MNYLNIVNLGFGNMNSLKVAANNIGLKIKYIKKIEDFNGVGKIIFPGQGNFNTIFSNYKNVQLIIELKKRIKNKTKILGICLGMQIMFCKNYESNLNGLSIFNGEVKRMENKYKNIKIPHIGWNNVNKDKYYFSHSYCTKSIKKNKNSFYLIKFCSLLVSKNIILTQFHPEKSFRCGLKIFKKI